ncbi:hypothetical protein ACJX0J_011230, partial [Zea mays]
FDEVFFSKNGLFKKCFHAHVWVAIMELNELQLWLAQQHIKTNDSLTLLTAMNPVA